MLQTLKPFALAAVRHALTAGGAILLANGYADASTVDGLVGGGLAVFSVVWALAEKKARL